MAKSKNNFKNLWKKRKAAFKAANPGKKFERPGRLIQEPLWDTEIIEKMTWACEQKSLPPFTDEPFCFFSKHVNGEI